VAVHRGVRVQGEALQHRDAPRARARSRSLDEAQALLRGSLLQLLVLVLWPRRLEVRPVLLRRAQHAGQNAGHLFVAGRRHRHHRPVGLPHPLSHEQMEVGRQLELTSEPLPEADCTARQRARRAVTPGFAALLPPHRLHQPHFEALEQLWLLDDVEAHREGEAQRPLPVRNTGQHGLEMHPRVERPARGAGRAPAPALAAERDDSRLCAAERSRVELGENVGRK
jgi:hypothetical protein